MWKKLVCLLSAVAILFGAMGLAGCVNEEASARKRINRLTEIEIPTDAKMEYHYRDDLGFAPGRESQYTVFVFENDPTVWLLEKEFTEGRNEEIEKHFTPPITFLSDLEIPDEYLAKDFENDAYLWLFTSGVYFFYSVEKQMLIVHIQGY